MKKAIILGAGPVGLVCAWKLLERGWVVEIYEKQDYVGGLCRSWKWGDFIVDTGPHIFHTPDAGLAKFWEDEFGDLFIKGDFWCKNVKGERFDEYWDYPLSWESISRYPKSLKEKILSELNKLSIEYKARARNYNQYMIAQVGEAVTELFFKRYPEKLWGISTEEMAPDWAPKRIEIRQKATSFYHGQWNAIGKFGTGCIFERIREKIIALGGTIKLNSEIAKIVYSDTNIESIELVDGTRIAVSLNDKIISSLPITALAGLLGCKSNLSFRGVRAVYLSYDKQSIIPGGVHWLYYDSDKVYFTRITEPKKLSAYMAPKDKTYITAEISYSHGDKIDKMDEAQLISEVSRQVDVAGLAEGLKATGGLTNKEDYVYPVHSIGYQQEYAKIRASIAKFGQLYSLGNGGEFNYADIQVLFHKAFDLAAILSGTDAYYTQVRKQTPRCKMNSIVDIGGRKIGPGAQAYIIAEAGLNHNGDLSLAKQLVDAAKRTGCDAIKFQTFSAESRISRKVKSVKYAEKIVGQEETLFEMFSRLAMDFKKQKELFSYAKDVGVEIFSTPFDAESAEFLESVGVKLYKISSMDLVNLPLISLIARTGKPIILSTGMSTLGQIEEAIEAVSREGNPNLMLLHCNSSYPAAPEEMNLNLIKTLKESFRVPVGLSDHTFGLVVSRIALALGADIIERHFTLDRTLEGPDHMLSSEPEELAELVKFSKELPVILGDGIKRIQPNEYDTLNIQRKCLYAARDIRKGQVIGEDMITIKGPGGGILPRYKDIVMGRTARVDIEQDYPITWESI